MHYIPPTAEGTAVNKYLDVSGLNPDKVVTYEKWVPDSEDSSMKRQHRKICLLTSDNSQYHKYCGFNQFSVETFPVPLASEGWMDDVEQIKDQYQFEYLSISTLSAKFMPTLEKFVEEQLAEKKRVLKKYVCDPSAKIFSESAHESCRQRAYGSDLMYKTEDNGDTGFVVFINSQLKVAHVFGRTNDVIPERYSSKNIEIFTELIGSYSYEQIFIGKSPYNRMTEYSGGHGKKWDGNSILLRLPFNGINLQYVYIGERVYEFTTLEVITNYVSSVGNNRVPYPYAESHTLCYDMLNQTVTPVADHPDRVKEGTVSYVKTASYSPMSGVRGIAERDSDRSRYPLDTNEITCLFQMSTPMDIPITHIKDSCNLYA